MTALQLTEQAVSQSTWFSGMPFGWLAVVAFAFWMGQDVYHHHGRLRVLYRHIRSFGEFGEVVVRNEWFSLGDDHGGAQKFAAISVPFRFSRKTKLDAIRIKSRYYRLLANKIKVEHGLYEWKIDEGKTFLSEDCENIAIAFIPEKHGHPGVYGDKSLNGYCFSEGTAHFITITLITPRRAQDYAIQVFMPNDKPTFDPPNDVDSGGRFLIFENMKLPQPTVTLEK